MEKVKDYFGIGTAIIISLAYLDIYFYYNLFQIDIAGYLTVSEIIFPFSFGLLSIAIALMYMLLINILYKHINKFFPKLSIVIGPFILICSVTLIAFYIMTKQSIFSLHSIPEFYLMFFCFLGFFLPVSISVSTFLKDPPTLTRNTIIIGLIFSTLVLYLHFINYVKFKNIENGYPKFDVEITRKKEQPIKTNKNFIFIGETANYIFFLSKISQSSVIIPKSEVVEIRKKQLRRGL
jgi:hypothetical protein